MSQKTTDGGPAFPAAPNPNYTDDAAFGQRGMTLRDWFAGQALAGMCGHPDGLAVLEDEGLAEDAELAYRLADAMLAARERKENV